MGDNHTRNSAEPRAPEANVRIVDVTVRRERRWTSAGATPARELVRSTPVAIETAAEATKLSELSMERVAWRLGERAGHNVSER
jgi:hypothetical protein